MALDGDEGRDKLRKATGIGTYDLIRRYPNGETLYVEDIEPFLKELTGGTETCTYPEEKKTIVIPLVAARERGIAQTYIVSAI